MIAAVRFEKHGIEKMADGSGEKQWAVNRAPKYDFFVAEGIKIEDKEKVVA